MLNPAPKPKRVSRKKNHYRRELRASENIQLKVFREEQRYLAIKRDSGWCVNCFFNKHKFEPAVEVHHVYGRGTWKTKDAYERYEHLICLCRSCHQDFHDRGVLSRETFIQLLDLVNNDKQKRTKIRQ